MFYGSCAIITITPSSSSHHHNHHRHHHHLPPTHIHIQIRPLRADFDVQRVGQAGQEKENHSEGEILKEEKKADRKKWYFFGIGSEQCFQIRGKSSQT